MLASISCARTCARRLSVQVFATAVFLMVVSALLCAVGPREALAQERIDPDRACSLTVRAEYDKQTLAGMEFTVRRVAEVDEQGRYALVGVYVDAGVELNGLTDAAGWDAAATELAFFAKEHALAADAESATGSDGEALFADLTCGVYLLQAAPLKSDSRTYTASTYLVALPGTGDSAAWEYGVTSDCKVSMTETGRDDDSDSGKDSGKDASGDTEREQSWAERWGLVQTGDGQLTVAGAICVTGLGALLVGLAIMLRRRCGEQVGRRG